jgi:hypothetical protein
MMNEKSKLEKLGYVICLEPDGFTWEHPNKGLKGEKHYRTASEAIEYCLEYIKTHNSLEDED